MNHASNFNDYRNEIDASRFNDEEVRDIIREVSGANDSERRARRLYEDLPDVSSDAMYLDSTPVPAPPVRSRLPVRHRSLLARVWTWIVLRHLNFELSCLIAEREGYQAAGVVGGKYLANMEEQERDLRGRIAMLECGL
jgi:hypothetical protein